MNETMKIEIWVKVGELNLGPMKDVHLTEEITSDDFVKFMLGDHGSSHKYDNATGNYILIPGDARIWYLATNESYGIIKCDGFRVYWKNGMSSILTVQNFINHLYQQGFLDNHQSMHLTDKLLECLKFDWCSEIAKYLASK